MNMNDRYFYTPAQKEFVRYLLASAPEVREYWERDSVHWDKHWVSLGEDIHAFIDYIIDALVKGKDPLAQNLLDLIEAYMSKSQEIREANLEFLFFETLTNRLGWKNPKYMQKFISMLGPLSKACCREVDRFWQTKDPGLWDPAATDTQVPPQA